MVLDYMVTFNLLREPDWILNSLRWFRKRQIQINV